MTPLNNNVLVRKLTKEAPEVIENGIILPAGLGVQAVTEEVLIVAVSPEVECPNAGCSGRYAKAGDRALIHRGLNGTPVVVDGVEHMMIGYVNLIAIL